MNINDVFKDVTELPVWAPHCKSKAPQQLDDNGILRNMEWADSAQWMTFDKAQDLFKANPLLLTGVGLFITSSTLNGQRLIAIDVDKIVGTYTEKVNEKGELVKVLLNDPAKVEQALKAFPLVNQIKTYWEISPSGMGLHAFAWVPEAWAAKYANAGHIKVPGCHHIEVYTGDEPTFITMTGNRMGLVS